MKNFQINDTKWWEEARGPGVEKPHDLLNEIIAFRDFVI